MWGTDNPVAKAGADPPPRMWGTRRHHCRPEVQDRRPTPTHVGNTDLCHPLTGYPGRPTPTHVGNTRRTNQAGMVAGRPTPTHVGNTLEEIVADPVFARPTPTHVGNTYVATWVSDPPPRMWGLLFELASLSDPPPRMWGIRVSCQRWRYGGLRPTPTHVGSIAHKD